MSYEYVEGNSSIKQLESNVAPEKNIRLREDKSLTPENQDLIRNQLSKFLEIREMSPESEAPYAFRNGTLVHNAVYNLESLKEILRLGVMSGEVGDEEKPLTTEDGETNFCADFFRVDEDLLRENLPDSSHVNLLVDYYQFAVMKTNSKLPDGSISPLRRPRIENYTTPTERNSNISFVFDSFDPVLASLLENSTDGKFFHENDDAPLKDIITRFPRDKEPEIAKNHVAVLVGLPANRMKAIVVGGKIAQDPEQLQEIYLAQKAQGLDIPVLDVQGNEVGVPNSADISSPDNRNYRIEVPEGKFSSPEMRSVKPLGEITIPNLGRYEFVVPNGIMEPDALDLIARDEDGAEISVVRALLDFDDASGDYTLRCIPNASAIRFFSSHGDVDRVIDPYLLEVQENQEMYISRRREQNNNHRIRTRSLIVDGEKKDYEFLHQQREGDCVIAAVLDAAAFNRKDGHLSATVNDMRAKAITLREQRGESALDIASPNDPLSYTDYIYSLC